MERLNLYYAILSWVDNICVILIAAYCCVVWTRPFLDRGKKAWPVGAAYAVTMLVLNLLPFSISPMLCYILGALAVFLMMCLLDREYLAQKLFVAVTFFCLRWQAPRVVVYLFNEINGFAYRVFPAKDELFWLRWDVLSNLLGYDVLTFLLFYGAVRCILWSYGKKREAVNGREFLLLTLPSLAGAVSYGVIRYYDNLYQKDVGKSVYDLYGSHDLILSLFTILSFIVILVTTYVFRQWKTQQEEDRQREIFSAQMADLQSHISEVEQLYRDMRGLRHDMANHLMTLKALYDKKEYDAAGQYADRLHAEITQTPLAVSSGNPVTDVILSGRKKEMEAKSITFFCDFHYPLTQAVDSFDISIILNNALSNAIEAVERERDSLETPQIFLSSGRRKNMYLMEIANSYNGEPELDPASGLPRSTKTDEGHGFGLPAIRHAAHKYLGDIELKKEIRDGKPFCVLRVMLQLPEE